MPNIKFSLKEALNSITTAIKSMPNRPGIYKFINHSGNILYIGKARVLPKRVLSYTKIESLPNRLRMMVAETKQVEYIVTPSEKEALLLEANLIQSHKPKYNILMKDDKSYPYIYIDKNHQFPRISKFRGKQDKIKGSLFGPFASAQAVQKMIVEMQKLFLVRPCSDAFFASRTRPCLEYQIKRCSGPCAAKITKEEYAINIKHVEDFLNGKDSALHKELISQMNEASVNMEYERAAKLRDKIALFNEIRSHNTFAYIKIKDFDIVALYEDKITNNICIKIFFIRNNKNFGDTTHFFFNEHLYHPEEIISVFIEQFYTKNLAPSQIITSHALTDSQLTSLALSQIAGRAVKIIKPAKNASTIDLMNFAIENAKTALARHIKEHYKYSNINLSLAKFLGLSRPIKRIEVYDNSHISGTNAIGAMVVATESGLDKKEYRTFSIKTKQPLAGGNDYAMLVEVLTRRLKNLNPQNHPDLLIIDGGKGHLSTALETMQQLNIKNINILCIAKGKDRNAYDETFYSPIKGQFKLPKNSELLKYIQKLRDEAHRFAIFSHRKKQLKNMEKSKLDLIPGIGENRKKTLIQHFGSIKAIENANPEDIAKVSGISKKIAQNIYSYLHDN